MTDTDNFDDMRGTLAVAVETYSVPTPEPLDINPWVAMSLLQKAIRRGRNDLAQRAAATLLHDTSRDRLWRRLGIIAVEDVGLGDLATVELVTVALAGKRVRAQLGGEWPVASYLVSRLSDAPKCRAADDLVMVATRHPAYVQARLELGHHCRQELMGIVSGKCSLVHRALSLMYLLGTDRGHERHLVGRRGRPGASAEVLSRAGCSPRLIALAEELHRKTREPLGPLVALLSRERGWESRITVDDPLPPEVMIGSVPGWAYDMFTRDGRTAYSRFLRGKTKTARWIGTHVAPAARLDLLGNLVFYVEGGELDQRLRWPVADDLRRQAEIECLGEGCADSTEVLGLLRADFPALNRSRQESMGGGDPMTNPVAELLTHDNPLLSHPSTDLELMSHSRAINCTGVEDVATYVSASLTTATQRAYLCDLAHFERWGGSIPATPTLVASYLAAHATSLATATLARRLASISKAHQARGLPNPVRAELVKATLQGIRRLNGVAQRQAKALLKEDLFVTLDALGADVRGVRDRALLLIGFAGGFRRSELVGLNVGDIEAERRGVILHLRRSKTDQLGHGRKIAIPYGRTRYCPILALEAWLAIVGAEGPLFRSVDRHGRIGQDQLSGNAVSGIIRTRLAAAGIDPTGYSGHSLRAGLATSAAQAGVPTWKIRQQTGHASDAMLSRYVRDGELFVGNAVSALL